MQYSEEYACKHCKGIIEITVLAETEKATDPMIEFCPFCGMSNGYPVEPEEDCITYQETHT